MEKQTAVEWLFEQIGNGNITSEKTDCGYLIRIKNDCYEQAKQMEKEHIMESFLDGVYEGSPTDEDYENCKVSGEQYYNKIYNK